MEDITNDPIISFYMKMSKKSDGEEEMPLFSETMLRLSFKQVFGTMRAVTPKELTLYRQLLLFNFSEQYTSISDLISIMTCFDEEEIRDCFEKHQGIIDEWQKFLRASLFPILFKEALHEILYEYANRHFVLFGQMDESQLRGKALDILQFLRFEKKLPKQWYRVFSNLIQNRNRNSKDPESYKNLSLDDLEIPNVYWDVKEHINPLVVEEIARCDGHYEEAEEKEPEAKKAKTDELGILKVELLPRTNLHDVTTPAARTSSQGSSDIDESCHSDMHVINSESINNERKESNESVDEENEELLKKQNTQEILEQVVVINEGEDRDDIDDDDEDSEYQCEKLRISDTEEHNSDNMDENTEYIETHDDDDDYDKSSSDGTNKQSTILDKEKALSYIAALQAYVVVNGHFQAIELLDKIDSMLREN